MVGVYGLTHPVHRFASAQPVEDIFVVKDRFHHDIMAHAGAGFRVALDHRFAGTGVRPRRRADPKVAEADPV
jgi:hypothetical protein